LLDLPIKDFYSRLFLY